MTFENIKTKINEVLPTSISEEQKSAGGETFRPLLRKDPFLALSENLKAPLRT